MSTPREVAQWMASKLEADGVLHQQDAAGEIVALFGDSFVYENEAGNSAISPPVLKAFRDLTGSTAVWIGAERLWRLREPYDGAGRRSE